MSSLRVLAKMVTYVVVVCHPRGVVLQAARVTSASTSRSSRVQNDGRLPFLRQWLVGSPMNDGDAS